MTEKLVISTDGAVSGRRATCAAVIAVDVRVIEVGACSLRDPHGYALAAETAGVALAGRLVGRVSDEGGAVTLEVGNTNVPRAIAGTYRPPGFNRIPAEVLAGARRLCDRYRVTFRVLALNATPGLRKADCLDGQRLWAHRRARSPVL